MKETRNNTVIALRLKGWVVTSELDAVAALALGGPVEECPVDGGAEDWRQVVAVPSDQPLGPPDALLVWRAPAGPVALVPGGAAVSEPPPEGAEVVVTASPGPGEALLADARLWWRSGGIDDTTGTGGAPALLRRILGRNTYAAQ